MEDGVVHLAVSNTDCFTRTIRKGTVVGTVSEATVLYLPSPTVKGEEVSMSGTDAIRQLLENRSKTDKEDSGPTLQHDNTWYQAQKENQEVTTQLISRQVLTGCDIQEGKMMCL